MKILAVSDVISPAYYEHYRPGRLDGIDLIISCGDLDREYLEFLVTLANCPLLYVPGNHDDTFAEHPPEGCISIDGRVFTYKGVRFAGLGGSYRYRRDAVYMYTERRMRYRVLKLKTRLLRGGGIDVFVTHAPAFGIGDLDDLPHRGFRCFKKILETYRPAYMVHGHVHRNYGYKIPQRRQYLDTTVINASGAYLFEIPEPTK